MKSSEAPTGQLQRESGLNSSDMDTSRARIKRSDILASEVFRRAGVIPIMPEWGPTHHRDDYTTVETPIPEGLTYSA
jgi:hypothetical protein